MRKHQVPSDVNLDAENPWPGLHEFEERGRDFFNGREEETAALLRLVRDAPLTVLYGRSGLGKTSLLKAGLFPRLRQEQFLPIYVRLDPRDVTAPLIEQALHAFREELQAQGVDHPTFAPDATLWEYLHQAELELWSRQNHLLTPVFVFDQFEEIFTVGAKNADAVHRFHEDLADLIGNRLPGSLAQELEERDGQAPLLNFESHRYRVLVSFREEFLPDVEGRRLQNLSPSRNRLRLLPMNGNQAFAAVFKTGGALVDEAIAREIVKFTFDARWEQEKSGESRAAGGTLPSAGEVADAGTLESLIIEPALLSLVCTKLNQRRQGPPRKPRIDSELLQSAGRAIITEFYEDCVRGLPERARRFIEEKLITEGGFRNSFAREDALSQGIVTGPELERLVQNRLLRVESHMGTDRIELIHDLLTGVVRDFRDRKREREKQEAEHRKDRRRRLQLALAGLIVLVALTIAGTFFWLWRDATQTKQRLADTLRAILPLKLSIVSRDILNGSQAGSVQLGLQLAATAFRLNPISEALGALQYGLRGTSGLLLILDTRSPVNSVAFSPDGTRLVTGNRDQTVRLWDAQRGQPIGEPLRGHEGWVSSVAFSPDGKRLVSGSYDRTVRLWDTQSGQPLGKPLRGHDDEVNSVAFSPDGARIVSGSRDQTVRLWDAQSGQPIGKPLCGHEGWVSSVAFSPDGTRIVSGSGDQTVRLWDAQSGQPLGEPLRGHDDEGWVSSVAFSPDGVRIVSGSGYWVVRLWDAQSGQPLGKPLRGHEGWVSSVAFSPDGTRIVSGSGDQTVRLWDVQSGQPLGEPLCGREGFVSSVAFSPDGKRIVSGSEYWVVRLWDAQGGQPLGKPLRGHEDGVSSAAFSPDGTRIVSGSRDETLRLWDARSGQAIGEPLRGHGRVVSSVAFSPDGKRIVSGSYDWTVRLWDAQSGQAIGKPLSGHELWVSSAAFSPDGTRIVSGSYDDTLRLWDAQSGQPLGEPLNGHDGWVSSVAFSPDGTCIASGSYDKTVRRWDAQSGQPLGEPLRGHGSVVSSVAFSPDGTRIVSGSYDKTVRLWDAQSGQAIGEPLRGHDGWVSSVAFSPDGTRIISGSFDDTVRLWDAQSGQPLGEPLRVHEGGVRSVAFSPDGKRIVAGSDDQTVRLWDGPEAWTELVCAKLTRNLSEKEWRHFVPDLPYDKQCPNLPVPAD